MSESNDGNFKISWDFDGIQIENDDWNSPDLDYEDTNDDESAMWNLDGLDFDQGESFSIPWNLVDFEETCSNDSSFRNSEDSVT